MTSPPRKIPRPLTLHPTCTYDLRYTTEPRCPECRLPLRPLPTRHLRIPLDPPKTKIPPAHSKAWACPNPPPLPPPPLPPRPRSRLSPSTPAALPPASRWFNVLLALTLLFAAIGLALQYPFFDPDHLRIRINYFHGRHPQLALTGLRMLSPAFRPHRRPLHPPHLPPRPAFAIAAALSWWTPFCFWILGKSNSLRHRAAPLSLYFSAWLLVATIILLLNIASLTFIHDIDIGDPLHPRTARHTLILSIPFTLLTWWLSLHFPLPPHQQPPPSSAPPSSPSSLPLRAHSFSSTPSLSSPSSSSASSPSSSSASPPELHRTPTPEKPGGYRRRGGARSHLQHLPDPPRPPPTPVARRRRGHLSRKCAPQQRLPASRPHPNFAPPAIANS